MTDHNQPPAKPRVSAMSRLHERLRPVIHYAVSWPGKLGASCRYWRDTSPMRGSRDMFAILTATKQFVKDEIPQILRLDAGTTVTLELPVFGSSTFVLIMRAGEQKHILRVYPMVHRKQAKDQVSATSLVLSHGVNVPRILYSSVDAQNYPAIFIVEEFIEGEIRAGDDLSAQEIAAMARQVARLHSARHRTWGRVHGERPQPFFLALTKRVDRDLHSLKQRSVLTDDDIRTITNWVLQWQEEFESLREWSLTHNDILPANGLFTPEGEYYMLDLNRLQWDVAAREVVRCYYRQFKGNASNIELFNQAYFAQLDPDHARQTWRFCTFYEVFYRISMLTKLAPKREKKKKRRAMYDERQEQLKAELINLVKQPHDRQTPVPASAESSI